MTDNRSKPYCCIGLTPAGTKSLGWFKTLQDAINAGVDWQGGRSGFWKFSVYHQPVPGGARQEVFQG